VALGEVGRVLGIIRVTYPGRVLADPDEDIARAVARLVRVYHRYWEDLETEAVLRAIDEHVATSRFWPTVAEIRERATRPVGMLDAETAWLVVWRGCRAKGPWPELDERTAAALEAVGGWMLVRDATTQQLPTIRAQFRDAYQATCARAVREANVGRLEAHRAARALSAGDVVKKLEVMKP
jgi:hypothetical protein